MTTWILTIGNSDIQLTTNENWDDLLLDIYDQLYDCAFVPTKVENENLWTVPARVIGLAYNRDLDNYYQYLYFPLLDSFIELLVQQNIIPDQIIILLSDQSNLFDDSDRYSLKSPYWKDTCTVEPIINKYLQNKFPNSKIKSLILKPSANSKGLDSWDKTLDLVNEKLGELSISEREKVYISHQAGTPALSSALQFISLAKFGDKVQFLVSSESQQNDCELIDSSRYLRGLKIQQAKSLVTNSPGAALKLLNNIDNIKPETINKLKYFVDFFNLNRTQNNNDNDFSIESATQRIIDVLDLIGIFFNQENFLAGITLLSSAQETFMKIAILEKTKNITVKCDQKSFLGSECLKWNNEGLFLTKIVKSIGEKKDILNQLFYPSESYPINQDQDLYNTNKNSIMLEWLQLLEPKLKPWALLQWSCKYHRNRENDLRNQLMHNLRGIEKQDVIKYLLADQNASGDDVSKVYNEQVKTPFFQAIKLINLDYTREKLTNELKKLADSLI